MVKPGNSLNLLSLSCNLFDEKLFSVCLHMVAFKNCAAWVADTIDDSNYIDRIVLRSSWGFARWKYPLKHEQRIMVPTLLELFNPMDWEPAGWVELGPKFSIFQDNF